MNSLSRFQTAPFIDALKAFFEELNVPVNYVADEPAEPADILGNQYRKDLEAHQLIKDVYVLGIVNDDIFREVETFSDVAEIKNLDKDYDGLLLLGITLYDRKDGLPISRGHLAEITRACNRAFPYTPVTIVFLHGASISFTNSERIPYKQAYREGEKVGKVSMLKDVSLKAPHSAHHRILSELKISKGIHNFKSLYEHWQVKLSTKELNDRFYKELFTWYLWALGSVKFPQKRTEPTDDRVYQSESLIRFITRILFVWFMKEKKLINGDLFQASEVNHLLKGFDTENPHSSNYYQAILQNLFFATLNMPIKDRSWVRKDKKDKEQDGNPLYYRFEDKFANADKVFTDYFANIPFLNGGLFECLDNKAEGVLLDGFTRHSQYQVVFPDYLFFARNQSVDLSEYFDEPKDKKKWSSVNVKGIIEILESYKFTIEENTPLEIDVALDPELLGKVFENLLASYNPETKATARKQTGSFYTPREIVNYMVDESLKVYLKEKLCRKLALAENDLPAKLDLLFDESKHANPFDDHTTDDLISAIDQCKILDPACGSGAFPMGVLLKLVHVLNKLDPHNLKWKEAQERRVDQLIEHASKIPDQLTRKDVVQHLEAGKLKIRQAFEHNEMNYGRKLFLIQNCIYGIDIQPIAIQISKLRFFISLLVDQNENFQDAENRGFEPLPNMDFKLVPANALISLPKGDSVSDGLFAETGDPFFKTFDRLTDEYFNLHLPKEKQVKKEAILSLINEKIDFKKKEIRRKEETMKGRTAGDIAKEIEWWDSYKNVFRQQTVGFFETPYFFPKVTDGFDVVIGNPPYIQMQKDGGKLAEELKTQKYQTYERTGDIYAIFYEQGINLLAEGGVEIFITSSQWLKANYGKSLRKYFLQYNAIRLLLLGPGVFESATVDTNILLIQKRPFQNKLKGIEVDNPADLESHDELKWVDMGYVDAENWTVMDRIVQSLQQKIQAVSKPLRQWNLSIYRGILTVYNEAFIIDQSKRDELISKDSKSEEIIRPILKGREINTYYTEWDGDYIIATFPAFKLDITKYPSVFSYLNSFQPKLNQSGESYLNAEGKSEKTRKKTGNKWFETQDQIAYYPEFKKEKVIWKRIGSQLRFTYSAEEIYSLDSTCIATGEKIKYLTGMLNSALSRYQLFEKAPRTGMGDLIISVQALEPLLVHYPNESTEKEVCKLVDEIITHRKAGQDSTSLERALDLLVFKIYQLSYEEVKLISPDFWLSKEDYSQHLKKEAI
jgi:hypothetical protein